MRDENTLRDRSSPHAESDEAVATAIASSDPAKVPSRVWNHAASPSQPAWASNGSRIWTRSRCRNGRENRDDQPPRRQGQDCSDPPAQGGVSATRNRRRSRASATARVPKTTAPSRVTTPARTTATKRLPPIMGASEKTQSPRTSGLTARKAWRPKSSGDHVLGSDRSGGSRHLARLEPVDGTRERRRVTRPASRRSASSAAARRARAGAARPPDRLRAGRSAARSRRSSPTDTPCEGREPGISHEDSATMLHTGSPVRRRVSTLGRPRVTVGDVPAGSVTGTEPRTSSTAGATSSSSAGSGRIDGVGRGSFQAAPPEVDAGSRGDVQLLGDQRSDVSDDERSGVRVERDAPRVAQAVDPDLVLSRPPDERIRRTEYGTDAFRRAWGRS